MKTITMSYDEYIKETGELKKKLEEKHHQIDHLRTCLRTLCAWNIEKNEPLADDYKNFSNIEGLVKYLNTTIDETVGW